MSTKIYNGYISKLNVEQLLVKFKAIVPLFDELKAKGYIDYLVKKTVYSIDKANYSHLPVDQIKIFWEHHEKSEKKIDETIKKGIRYPDLDFSGHCVVFPLAGKTLILLYVDNSETLHLWEKQKYISEYHYQNQTDPPKNISSADWKRRERDWDKVLGNEVPARAGYSFLFCNAELPFMSNFEKHHANWRLYVSSRKDRALKLLKAEFFRKGFERIGAQYGESKKDFLGTIDSVIREEWKSYEKSKSYKIDLVFIRKGLPKINLELKKK